MTPKPYDTTVAIMAATIYGCFRWNANLSIDARIERSVLRARQIVDEVQRTEQAVPEALPKPLSPVEIAMDRALKILESLAPPAAPPQSPVMAEVQRAESEKASDTK